MANRASVSYRLGRTVPIGSYENFKITCEVTLECEEKELELAYEKAREFVTTRVAEEEADLLGKFD